MVSLIVCTYGRSNRLPAALAAFARLKCKHDWELIIVGGGSDDTESVALKFIAEANFPVFYVPAPGPGLGRARNIGIGHARGEILAFTDDDCYPEPDFLDRSVEAFDDATVGFVGGRALLYDPSDYAVSIQVSEERLYVPPRSYIRSGAFIGACMAVRRRAAEAVGFFDPELGSGTPFPFEDIDILARLSNAGWAGLYEPSIVVHHHHERKHGEARTIKRQYDRGRGAYYAKLLLLPMPLAFMRYVIQEFHKTKFKRKIHVIQGIAHYLFHRLVGLRPR